MTERNDAFIPCLAYSYALISVYSYTREPVGASMTVAGRVSEPFSC